MPALCVLCADLDQQTALIGELAAKTASARRTLAPDKGALPIDGDRRLFQGYGRVLQFSSVASFWPQQDWLARE